MKTVANKPSAYRWAVMLAFMAVAVINQLVMDHLCPSDQ